MSGIWFFHVHRSRDDWISMLIGVVTAILPWLAEAGLDVERAEARSARPTADANRYL
jgi:hypothetical protein